MEQNYRMGQGFDVHAFGENRKLILGGIEIPYDRGLVGHSDADVLIHALCDALLGAAGLNDIGFHFPDTDPQYKNADSSIFLFHTVNLLQDMGWAVGNVDVTIIAQEPKISPHIAAIKSNLARLLCVSESQVSVKATTTEWLGYIGRKEGMAAQAIAMICRSSPGA